MPYFSRDDIAQIGTAPGPGLVGAIRLSGDNAFAILGKATVGLERLLAGRPARAVHPCRIMLELACHRRENGVQARARRVVPCPARALLMPAPASSTREDVAELHLPASPALLQAGLAALVRAGARPAAPGEFTFRAFRNGRLSLGQAEAVEAVIRAGNEVERRQALSRLGDSRRAGVEAWRDRILALAARVEAALDFSGEELDDGAGAELAAVAREMELSGLALARPDRAGESGLPHLALVGLTNAGKRSLFNALLGDEAALVSPRAATTRDHLRREVEWDGVGLALSDNPGHNPGEAPAGGRLAAERAGERLGGEDLACWVVDASRPPGEREEDFARRLSGTVLVVLNKCDLPAATTAEAVLGLARRSGLAPVGVLEASAAAGTGVDALRARLAGAARGLAGAGGWNRREVFELTAALDGCREAARELAGPGRLELAAEDLRRSAAAFSRALGEGYAEEVLTRIFSRFCIGK